MKLIMEKCPTDMCHASTITENRTRTDFLQPGLVGPKKETVDVAIWIAPGEMKKHFEEPENSGTVRGSTLESGVVPG